MTSPSSEILLLPLAVVAAIGWVMIVRGLRFRRRGDTPHCRTCNYPLTGLTDPMQCPECGAVLTDPTAVVFGERYRAPRRAAAGAVVLLLAGAPLAVLLTGSVRSYDWYRLRPARWVLDDVERSRSLKGAEEICRRYKADTLSASHRDRLIELALAEQGRSTGGGGFPSELVDFLSVAESKGHLSGAQRQRFFDQMVLLTLTAPSRVAVGANVVFVVNEVCRSPGGTWSVSVHTLGAELVGEGMPPKGATKPRGESWGGFSGLGASGTSSSSVRAQSVGNHQLRVYQSVEVFKDGTRKGATRQPTSTRDVVLTADVEVVLAPGNAAPTGSANSRPAAAAKTP